MKTLLLVFPLLCCSIANAEQKFVPVWKSEAYGVVISIGTVRDSKIDGNKTVWVKAAGNSTILQLTEFNCREELSRIIASNWNGTDSNYRSDWFQVFPESHEARVMSFACKAS